METVPLNICDNILKKYENQNAHQWHTRTLVLSWRQLITKF